MKKLHINAVAMRSMILDSIFLHITRKQTQEACDLETKERTK